MNAKDKFKEKFKDKFIDTHCHLDSLKGAPLEELLHQAQMNQVEKVITIGVEPGHLSDLITLTQKYRPLFQDQIFCTQGIHPHEAQLYTDEVEKLMVENLTKNPQIVVAFGEMGLDYHYDHSPRNIQQEVFERQLELASHYQLPVVIHTREADVDTMRIIKNYSARLPAMRKGVFHSFTSSRELAELALGEGFYLGINGIITFKNAESLRQIVQMTPLEQIVFETDAPYLTPIPYRGKENHPAYLPLIAKKVAEVKRMDEAEVYQQVYLNSLQLFNLSSES